MILKRLRKIINPSIIIIIKYFEENISQKYIKKDVVPK